MTDQERCNRLFDVERMPNALAQMHKNIPENNQRRHTQAKKLHNAKTSMLQIEIEVRQYVIVRMQEKKEHRLPALWRGPMRVRKAKSHLVFEVEDINETRKILVHIRGMVPYPITQRSNPTSI